MHPIQPASSPVAPPSAKLLVRVAILCGVIALLLIPLEMIRSTIGERARYRAEAVERVIRNTADQQQVLGPLVAIPWTDERQEPGQDSRGFATTLTVRSSGVQLVLPKNVELTGALVPNVLRVGLYEVTGYEWRATLRAQVAPSELPSPVQGAVRTWGAPQLLFGVSDVRGLVGTPALRVDGQPLPLHAGAGKLAPDLAGMHATLSPVANATFGGASLELTMVLRGTHSLTVAPVGDDNTISIESSWPHPSFEGYSPRSAISDSGFTAQWKVSGLASRVQSELRAAAQSETSGVLKLPALGTHESLKVSLVNPVDVYTQSDRASKYALLFIVLTFAGFVLFELARRLAIHPLQYLLVGLSLALFFLLLVSLSEHMQFVFAYASSAAAQIGVLFMYLSGVLRSWRRAGGFAATLSSLYGILYCILDSEDNAFLMGTVLLFTVLAAVMAATRKIDWYELTAQLTRRPPQAPAMVHGVAQVAQMAPMAQMAPVAQIAMVHGAPAEPAANNLPSPPDQQR